jgi:DNA-binding HxlR family transcriptional regulator
MTTPSQICPLPETIGDATECPMARSLALIANKWAPPILYHLHRVAGPLRFSELRRLIPGITQKELTKRLRDLEHAGVVSRTVHAEVPPRVEYCLTEFGLTLEQPLGALAHWALTHGQRLLDNRAVAARRA